MTEQELKKLNRGELLLLIQRLEREKDQLQERMIQMERQQRERGYNLKRFGSIAESALQVSGVFEAAQKAADQYLHSAAEVAVAARHQKAEAEKILAAARQESRALWEQTSERCADMLKQAEAEAQSYWKTFEEDMYQRLENYVPAWHLEQEQAAAAQAEAEELPQEASEETPEEAVEVRAAAEETGEALPEEGSAEEPGAEECPAENPQPEEEAEETCQPEEAPEEEPEPCQEEAEAEEAAEETEAEAAEPETDELPEEETEEAEPAPEGEAEPREEEELLPEEPSVSEEEALLAQIIAEFAPVGDEHDGSWDDLLGSLEVPEEMLPLDLELL